jgi:putative membrane protein
MSRQQLTDEKRKVIRLIVAFVIATKHHLRGEGGVHYPDLESLLPSEMDDRRVKRLRRPFTESEEQNLHIPRSIFPMPTSPKSFAAQDEESIVGMDVPKGHVTPSVEQSAPINQPPFKRSGVKRRPTAVRIVTSDNYLDEKSRGRAKVDERTPLVAASVQRIKKSRQQEEVLGRMVELCLPLIMWAKHLLGRHMADETVHTRLAVLFSGLGAWVVWKWLDLRYVMVVDTESTESTFC